MKKLTVKTRRMVLSPMTQEEIAELIARSPAELAQAYGEMLDGCRKDPDNAHWYAPWKMCLRKTGQSVGDLGFKGPPHMGRVEIGYGIRPEYEGRGLTTEAVKALYSWAIMQDNVYYLDAETEASNAASQRVLEKAGFKPTGITGEEGPRFAREKAASAWKFIYACFGIFIGASLGSAMGGMAIGMLMGLVGGMSVGSSLDKLERQRREIICAQNNGKD